MESFVHHVKKGKEIAHEAREQLSAANKEHLGRLDFGAYRYAQNDMYTGWKPACPPIFYGKVWGTDSSGMQGVLNPYGYWKRVYYREADVTKGAAPLGASASEPSLPARGTAPGDTEPSPLEQLRSSQSMTNLGASTAKSSGYLSIKENFEDDVLNRFKPQVWKKDKNDPLKFHNTLMWKYNTDKAVKLRMQPLPKYEYPEITHRSTKNELKFITSLYHRKDVHCLNPHPLKRIWGDA